MKVDITKAQLVAIVELANETSSIIGGSSREADNARTHWVRLVDRFLKKNGYKRKFK